MERKTVYLVYTLIEKSESVSDCHTLYATLERAKAAMDREIEEAMENFGKGYGFTVGIDEMMPL